VRTHGVGATELLMRSCGPDSNAVALKGYPLELWNGLDVYEVASREFAALEGRYQLRASSVDNRVLA
jgi:hypothetical protein